MPTATSFYLYPLAWTAAALWAGTLLASRVTGGGELALTAAAVLTLLALVPLPLGGHSRRAPGRLAVRRAAVLLASASLGLGLGQVALYRLPADDVASLLGPDRPVVRMEVAIADGPRWSAGTHGRDGATWTGDVLAVEGEPASGRIRVRVSDGARDVGLRAGERAQLIGRWSVAGPPRNPGQADFGWIDRTRGLRGTLDVRGPGQITSRSADTAGLAGWLGAWRTGAVRLLSLGIPASREEEARILRALLLGETDNRLASLLDTFQRLGVTHHLVVSGTHLAVVGGFVWVVLRAVMGLSWAAFLTPRRVLAVTLTVVAAYGLAVAPGEAVSRSVLLALLVGAGLMLGRQVRVINLLGLCCIVLLLIDPLAAFRPGFQLTFGVVWALCAGTAPLAAAIRAWRDRDVAVADAWRLLGAATTAGGRATRAHIGWVPRARVWAWGPGVTMLSAAVVAWLASVPIVAFHFGQLSPWAAVASVALTPVVFTAIVIAGLKVVLTGLIPCLAGLWAIPAWMTAWLLRESGDVLSLLPAGDVGGAGIPAPVAVALTGALVAAIHWGRRLHVPAPPGTIPTPPDPARDRRRLTVIWVVAAAAILLTPLASRTWRHRTDPGLRLTLLSVGSAQCAVLELPDGSAAVIDVGSSGGDVYRQVLEPYLRSRGIRDLRWLLLSHGDADHTAGAALLMTRRRVGELLIGEQLQHAATADLQRGYPSPAAAALATARQRGVAIRIVSSGHSWNDGEVLVDVLHPEPGRWQGLSPNDASLVLRVQYAGRVLLLGSDVELAGQAELLRHPALLRCDVLVIPHHGSWEPTLLRVVEACGANHLLISDDATPSGTQTRFHRQAAESGLTLLRTSQVGAITVTVTTDGALGVHPYLHRP